MSANPGRGAFTGAIENRKGAFETSLHIDERDHVVFGVTKSRHVAEELDAGRPVALGFECPLFIPLRDDEAALTSGRPGEDSRPWSAGAGSGALAVGLVQVAWTLQEVRHLCSIEHLASLSWDQFASSRSGLFLWEAFVSGPAKSGSHVGDAEAAVRAFCGSLPDPRAANAISCSSSVYSLVGSALLRTGWRHDIEVLKEPCLVIRA
jgi:hypothetical protein